jgi:NAD+ synthase (glutamine-hydrolysing)
VLGVVPKSYLPNYREYYEKRWFAPGVGLTGLDIPIVAGQTVPFGPDLIFAASDLPDFVFHVEICEDYWAPIPPSSLGALAGALILTNLSASNIVVGKERERDLYGASQSARATAAYVYSASGPGESTTDLAWDGQAMIHELGYQLAKSARLRSRTRADLRRYRCRAASVSIGCASARSTTMPRAPIGDPEQRFRRIALRASVA